MFERADLEGTLSALGVDPSGGIFEELAEAYGEPSRYYHTQKHIAECLAQLGEYRHLAQRPSEIEIGIWFHDAVYDTHRNDNEELSARWAERYLTLKGADPKVVERVVSMILATKLHEALDPDTALMVDIDLGILGALEDAFERYDQAIRREYSWVPEAQYTKGRANVLKLFLGRNVIYRTAEIREQYEARARENIARKLRELGA